MTGLRYSPLHVPEFCGEMQGKFKISLARLKIHKFILTCALKQTHTRPSLKGKKSQVPTDPCARK